MFKSYINRRSVTVRKTHSGISCDWQTINFWSVNFRIQRCSAPWFCGFAAHLLQCRDGNPLCSIDLGLCSFPPSMPRDKINKPPPRKVPSSPRPAGPLLALEGSPESVSSVDTPLSPSASREPMVSSRNIKHSFSSTDK